MENQTSDSLAEIPEYEVLSREDQDSDDTNFKYPIKTLLPNRKRYYYDSVSSYNSNDSNSEASIQTEIIRNKQRKPILRTGKEVQESFENFERKDKEKDSKTLELIGNALAGHFVFKSLDQVQTNKLAHKFSFGEIKKGEILIRQGDPGKTFFILEYGKVSVSQNEKEKSILAQWTTIGEYSLLYNFPRTATITAVEDCGLWYIDRPTFREFSEAISLRDFEENKECLENFSELDNLTPEQKQSIASILIRETFKQNEFIIHEGDSISCFYFIKSGSISIMKEGLEIKCMKAGQTIGVSPLLESNIGLISAKATMETTCLVLSRESITQILGDDIHIIIYKNLASWAMERDEVLKNLTKIQKYKIIDNLQLFQGKKDQWLIKAGHKCQHLIIPLESQLLWNTAQGPKAACQPLQCFGAEYCFKGNENTPLEHDLIVESDGAYFQISVTDFFNVIGGPLEVVLEKNEKSHEKLMYELYNQEETKSVETNLNELLMVKEIGYGQFGDVYLVEDLQQNQYALKCISKVKVEDQNVEELIQNERFILQQVKFPFILKFYRTFKCDQNVYFLTEFIRGVDLFEPMNVIGLFSRKELQFYVGLLILDLEYLHMKNIVYRDLKPQNVMVDEQGYIKLIDLGACKVLAKPARTFTIVGTPNYMAPEVLDGTGYSFSADLWSLGVCFYEFLCGYVPYGDNIEDPMDIYDEIMNKKLIFPSFIKDKKSKKLIEQLLSTIPEARSGGSYTTLKSHPWFSNFDWDGLLTREFEPPYIPNIQKTVNEDVEQARKSGQSFADWLVQNRGQTRASVGNQEDEQWFSDF